MLGSITDLVQITTKNIQSTCNFYELNPTFSAFNPNCNTKMADQYTT